MDNFISAEAGYNREAFMKHTHGNCNFCKKKDVEVIEWDNSEGEYGPHNVCVKCLGKLMRSKVIPDPNYCKKCLDHAYHHWVDDKAYCNKCNSLLYVDVGGM